MKYSNHALILIETIKMKKNYLGKVLTCKWRLYFYVYSNKINFMYSKLIMYRLQSPFCFLSFSQGKNLPVEVCVCSARHRYAWLGVLFLYKGILLTIGVFLAFETRKVKIRQLNDSHLIAMCVYATVVLSIALAPIGLVLETSVDVFYAIVGFMVLFGTTLILLLLYIPKVHIHVHCIYRAQNILHVHVQNQTCVMGN